MKSSFAMRASVMLLATAILSGCAASPPLDRASSRIGVANAGVQRVRQPEECRKDWPLLARGDIVGREKLVVIDKYESYIAKTINPTKRRCWTFNDNIYAGLAGK